MAITGASGAPYAVRLLESLIAAERPVSSSSRATGCDCSTPRSDIDSVEALRAARRRERLGSMRDACFDDADRGAAAGVRIGAQRRHGDLSVLDGHAVAAIAIGLVALIGRARG